MQIDKYQRDTNISKLKILTWINQYLLSYRETSKNWNSVHKSGWISDIYRPYFISKQKQNLIYLYRDALSQILVELPFIINSAAVILGVYIKYITLTQLFIWVGFCQFMINASNSYFDNRVKKKEREILTDQSMSVLSRFKHSNHEMNEESYLSHSTTSEIMLRDGSTSILSLKPGIYRLFGGNGSGKSTLLNMFLGYERRYAVNELKGFNQLIKTVRDSSIRVIERDAVLFESFSGFDEQISGPCNSNFKMNWKNSVIDSINYLLESTLANQWILIFLSLEIEYMNRVDKNMSSGEKVILSFIRFFASWDRTVCLLVIDECDSFLDYDKKNLFKEAINHLSRHMAIFISSHDSSVFEANLSICHS